MHAATRRVRSRTRSKLLQKLVEIEHWSSRGAVLAYQFLMSTMLENARLMIAGELPPAPMAPLIGLRLVAIEPGRARFELDADHRHHNPMGTLHGGILCDIADSAMGMAYASTLGEGEIVHDAGAEDQFPAAGTAARVWSLRAPSFSRARSAGMAECVVTDEGGRLIAKAEHLPDAARRAGARPVSMRYREQRLPPPLDAVIECVWFLTSEPGDARRRHRAADPSRRLCRVDLPFRRPLPGSLARRRARASSRRASWSAC